MFKLAKQDREYIETWRGVYSPAQSWYAAMTRFGAERATCREMFGRFGGDGIEEAFLPEIESGSDGELLFPCYVFLRCRMSDEIYMQWTECVGVVSVLGRAWRIPTILDEREIGHLKAILKSPEPPRVSTPTRAGDFVEVTGGMMQGLRGRIVEAGGTQVKLETRFSFLNDMTAIVVSVAREHIRPVEQKYS